MPTYFIVAVPILAAIVSGWLCDDDLAPSTNSIISMITLVSVAWLWSLVGRAVIVADQATNIVAVVVFSLALITPISPLYYVRQWLMVRVKSPLAALPTITISVRSAPPLTEQRSTLPTRAAQRWTATPPLTPPPTTWQPSREAQGIHHGDTLSIPAIAASQPPTPSSQPLTLRPPYPQKGTTYS